MFHSEKQTNTKITQTVFARDLYFKGRAVMLVIRYDRVRKKHLLKQNNTILRSYITVENRLRISFVYLLLFIPVRS